MLAVRSLHARIGDKEILKGLDIEIPAGEVHAIMGPNGAGKSTLANVLAGKDGYEVTQGSVELDGKDLLSMNVEERACSGLFLGFQYPVEIPGISNVQFLREAVNAVRSHRGQPHLKGAEFLRWMREQANLVQLDESFIKRGVNEGFSGGEKKRNEIFQLAMLEPRLAILDETDSGLDIDALKTVANGVNALRASDRSFLLITHYQRLLRYIVPDVVHVFKDGRIVERGDANLAEKLEREGYVGFGETA